MVPPCTGVRFAWAGPVTKSKKTIGPCTTRTLNRVFHRMSPTPEQQARERIDAMLTASGWAVQDKKALNPAVGRLRQAFLERAFERRLG